MQPAIPVVLVRSNNDFFYNNGGFPPVAYSPQSRLSFPYGLVAVPENTYDCNCPYSRQQAATTIKKCCCSDETTAPLSTNDESNYDRVADRANTRKRKNSDDAKDESSIERNKESDQIPAPAAKRLAEAKPAENNDKAKDDSDDDDDDSNGKLSASVQVSRKEQFLDGGNFNVTIDVEKYKTDNLKVEVDGRRVTVSGKKLEEVEEEGWRITRLKYLSHVYTVPQSIDIDKLTSSLSCDNKVLTLQAPRSAPDTPKTIPIEIKTAVIDNGKLAPVEVTQTDSTTNPPDEQDKPQDALAEKESGEKNSDDTDQPTSNSEN